MQNTSGVISALCYLIPIVVTEWLKILHLFLATIFLGSRRVLFSSFYGNGDRGAKNHFCNATRKPPSLHRDVGRNISCAALHLLPGAGFGQAGTSSWGTVVYLQWRLWADPAARHSPALCRTEVLLLWQESAGQHCRAASSSAAPLQWTTDQETGSWLLTENVGCTQDQRAALVTQTWFIYLHSAKHNHYETKRRQFAPQEETVPVCAASKQLQVRSQAISQASAALENVLVSL